MAVEAEVKALDKRVGGIERKLDELDKAWRAAGDFKALDTQIKALDARVKALEQICKVLMEARTESKATAARMIADVAVLNKQTMSKETVDKMFEQRRKVAEAQAMAEARALEQKLKAEMEANLLKVVQQQFKAVVETRLLVLEKTVQALPR